MMLKQRMTQPSRGAWGCGRPGPSTACAALVAGPELLLKFGVLLDLGAPGSPRCCLAAWHR